MGRHQRRGYVGQTNLPSPHKLVHHSGLDHAPPVTHSVHGTAASATSPASLAASRKRPLRAKWKLDLAPVPRGLERLHETKHDRQERDTPEAVLAASIEAVQHDRKSFKDEPWYSSPIGAGSKSSVILAALKQQDHRDTGFLSRASILTTLQQEHFGLTPKDAHKLLNQYDPAQDQIHYKTFVQHLHFAESPIVPDDHDIIFRHQRYLEKIHDHAARLLAASGETLADATAGSPLRLSPLKRDMLTNCEPGVVQGDLPMHSPSRRLAPLADAEPSPSPTRHDFGDDRLSFVHDKQRREQRTQAKAAILLAHISRVEQYARQKDAVTVQQDSLRIANKAFHHGEHLARVFDEQHRQLRRLENQGKALLDSPLTMAQRNVSKQSMFYVESSQ